MAAYTKDFLVAAFLHRFLPVCTIEQLCRLEDDAVRLYDEVGRDRFRQYASLDADAIKLYKTQQA